MKKKQRKIKVGDIFLFGNSDQGWGCGQVMLSDINQYIVIYEPIISYSKFSLEDITSFKPLIAGWTMDARFLSGHWDILGDIDFLPDVPFPEFKVKIKNNIWVTDIYGKKLRPAERMRDKALPNKFSMSPVAFEKAFWAHHDNMWESRFDKLLLEPALS